MAKAQSDLTIHTAHKTVVSCDSDKAHAIFLAGTFNNWKPAANPMTRDGLRHWIATMVLPPGRYEYKFVVDGKWCCEPGCTAKEVQCGHCIMNEFGTMNRVLEVLEP